MLKVEAVFAGYYRDIHVLQGVSVKAQVAQITAIIGPNGVGKSTLLKVIYGFLKPHRGRILYNDGDITGMAPYTASEKGLAYIPQRRNVFPYLSVEENMAMGAWTFRRHKTRIREKLEQNYKRFPNLARKRKVKAGFLSGGEQRMVELGRALMPDPDLLLVDEPTAGLAPMFAKEIRNKLIELKEEGKAIVLVEQNIREAIEISDYIYVLDLGRNKAEGSQAAFATDLKDLVKDWLF
ncbi:MAG: ABC transporter ATP-binding protein [Candidatus Bipolaricaulia bacterium]